MENHLVAYEEVLEGIQQPLTQVLASSVGAGQNKRLIRAITVEVKHGIIKTKEIYIVKISDSSKTFQSLKDAVKLYNLGI